MLVILRENVENLGRIGEVVKVSDGYARNFLLPRRMVVQADDATQASLEHHRRRLEKKRQEELQDAKAAAQKLADFAVNIIRKVGENDKLFGSVTATDIADVLKAAGFKVDKRSIEIENPIKTLGVHPVSIRLEPEVTATVKVWVVKES